jgi:predicted ATPase/class 3 adenylate cyclase
MVVPPSGTVTFLFTDIEGSSKMWEESPQAMGTTLARHDDLLRSAIEGHGGYVFKTVGDAFCAAFPTALGALQAALAAQRAFLSETWREETGFLGVRMALHTGATIERDGDYFGPPLNRVARLLNAAHGGQVLLSAVTQELVKDQLPADTQLRDLGEGYLKDLSRPERVFQLVVSDLPSDFPPLRTLESYPNNLPLQATPLIGRVREVEEVSERIRGPETRLLTLVGPGGTGKTRVGLQAAAELVEDFEDGVFYVPMATFTDPDLVAPTIARTLGLSEGGARPPEAQLADYLREKHTLLLLDNLEQIPESAPVLDRVLSAAARLKILVTSRTPLRLYGEQEFPVPPLSLPDPGSLPPLENLADYEAVGLFVERARAVKPEFSLTEENADAVVEICRRLDGLPLAIELAAARVKLLPPRVLLERLGNRLEFLTGGARNLPERQRTLRNAIEWSYGLLDEDEKALFVRFGVFSGGATLEAMEAVCDAQGNLPMDTFEGVSSLLDKSLLRQEEGAGGEPRFVMLETIREFANGKLEGSGEAEALRRVHAEHFLALAEEAEPRLTTGEQVPWLNRLEDEYDNLRGALSWSLERREGETALRLGGALWRFWYVRGHTSEGRRWLEEALSLNARGAESLRARALNGAGHLAWSQDDHQRAEVLREESLALSRQAGDKREIADALNGLGFVALRRGNFEAARKMHEEALLLSREIGDRWGIAHSIDLSGRAAAFQGDYAAARPRLEAALEMFREVGDRSGIAESIGIIGMAALGEGDYQAARLRFEEARKIMSSLGDRRGIGKTTTVLGDAVFNQGDRDAARSLYVEALEDIKDQRDKWWIAWCLEGMAGVDQNELGRAVRLFGAAAALREEIGAPRPPAFRGYHERNLTAVRNQLGQEAFEKGWAEGGQMMLDEAIEYALEVARRA